MQKWLESESDENYKIAYRHLRDCFYNYFSTPLDECILPDIQWIDYPFAANYPPAKAAIAELKANLFNNKAMKTLVRKLEIAGAFGDKRTDFFFSNADPRHWPKISYQARPVHFYRDPLRSFTRLDWPAQYMASGDFTIDAIPEGYVQPRGNGNYDICVEKVFFFVNDSFNFEGHEILAR